MGFLNYIHNFRGIAILYIILNHTISAFNWDSSENARHLLRTLFAGSGTVLFVFIAGYLFQHLSTKYEYKSFLKKKFQYVFLPYLICSIPAILYFVFFEERWNTPEWLYEKSDIYIIFFFYVTGRHLAPFWFMPMIFMYHLISPILIWIDRKKTPYIVIPVFMIITMIVLRGYYPHQNFIHFFSIFLIGMFCSRFKDQVIGVVSNKLSILFCFFAICFLIYIEYFEIFKPFGDIHNLFYCAFYLGILKKYDHVIGKIFANFATASFGMYFLHSYIISSIKLLYDKSYGDYFNGTLLNYFIFSVFVIFMSYWLVVGIQKLFGKRSRYIIGS